MGRHPLLPRWRQQMSGRRSWLSPALSTRTTPHLVATSRRWAPSLTSDSPKGRAPGLKQGTAPASLACASTKVRLLHTYWLLLERFQNSLRVPIGQAPEFWLRRFNNEFYNTFSFITYEKELCPPFPSLLLCVVVILVRARPCSPHSSPN